MSVEIVTLPTERFADDAADTILHALVVASNQSGNIGFGLAGGSTPKEIYQRFTSPERMVRLPQSRLKVFLGDERWVPVDSPESNFKMATDSFLHALPAVEAFPIVGSSPEEAALRYQQKMIDILGPTPSLAVMLLGMGDDGHTASLFPHSPLLTDHQGFVGVAPHPTSGQIRISLLSRVLLSSKTTFVLVKGRSKAPMLHRVLHDQDTVEELPIKLLMKSKERVVFLVDEEASGS